MRVIFAILENGSEPPQELGRIFDGEYYASLKSEDEAYKSKPSARQRSYIERVVNGVYERSPELENYIVKYSIGWRADRISRVATAIIMLAMYEALYMPDVPGAAAINDAVNIGKRYETPETVAFINGVLGSFSREESVCGQEPAAPLQGGA
jgi:N utilization substance protein B